MLLILNIVYSLIAKQTSVLIVSLDLLLLMVSVKISMLDFSHAKI